VITRSKFAGYLAFSFLSIFLFSSLALGQTFPLPTVVATVALEGQTAGVPPTLLFTPKTTHMFRVSSYAVITGGGGPDFGECAPGNAVAILSAQIDYNDGTGQDQLAFANGLTWGGTYGSDETNIGGNSQGDGRFVGAAGQPINYELDLDYLYGSSCTPGLQYNVYIVLERLSTNLP
jgi:hypothetical protein